MRPSKRDIIITSRRSPLALSQSEAVGRYLHQLNPRVQLRMAPLDSDADRVSDHPLARFGGKGLFTRSIEQALLDGRADIAVHSLKDMPTQATRGLVLAAITRRQPPRDVLIARDAQRIEDLPEAARVGTCSPRRAAQLLRVRPDLNIEPLRGNVETRLARVMNDKALDATILASAGLRRLNLPESLGAAIPVDQMLPAAGQGALAVQCRGDDHTTLRRCIPVNDAATSVAVNAEREVVAVLGADCHSPIAALAEHLEDNTLRLRVRVLSGDGQTCLESDHTAPMKAVRKLCRLVAAELIAQGAREVLFEASTHV